MTLQSVKNSAILEAVHACGGNRCAAARMLKIGKTSIYRHWRTISEALPFPERPKHYAVTPVANLEYLKIAADLAATYLQSCVGQQAPQLGLKLEEALRGLEDKVVR